MDSLRFQEEIEDNQEVLAERKYLSKIFQNINKGCNNFYENILLTEKEYKKLPFFSRSKSLKNFEQQIGLDFSEIKNTIIQVQNLWRNIDVDLQSKKFDRLNDHLRTYRYSFGSFVDKFSQLDKYYDNVPEVFTKIYKNDEELSELKRNYEVRQKNVYELHENLHTIYDLLLIE